MDDQIAKPFHDVHTLRVVCDTSPHKLDHAMPLYACVFCASYVRFAYRKVAKVKKGTRIGAHQIAFKPSTLAECGTGDIPQAGAPLA